VTHGLQGTRFVCHRLTCGGEGLGEGLKAKHLGRLGQPLVVARERGLAALPHRLFEGIGQRQGQEAPHRVLRAVREQAANELWGHEAASRVVHQHPVVFFRAQGLQAAQTLQHAGRAGGAPVGPCRPGRPQALQNGGKLGVLRGTHHHRELQLGQRRERPQRVANHGLTGDGLVLFGLWGARTLSTARAGNDDVKRTNGRVLGHGLGPGSSPLSVAILKSPQCNGLL